MVTYVFIAYIALLLVGGVMGFVKAGSKVSLVMSLVFAAAIGVCVFANVPRGVLVAQLLQLVLVAVFVMRFLKTRKFMPSGLMIVVTVLALALELAL
jgi:uncharacterized membrane protein (UPF0136 family)